MVALALIGTSALTNTYIKNNDILVTLRDYNGEAKLSDELQELKDLITLTQGGAWFIIVLNFIAIVMSVTTVVLIAINKYPTPFTTVVSLDFIKLID